MLIPRRKYLKITTFALFILISMANTTLMGNQRSPLAKSGELLTLNQNQDFISSLTNFVFNPNSIDKTFDPSLISSNSRIFDKIDPQILDLTETAPIDMKANLLIYFQDWVTKNQRVDLLRTWFPQGLIEYNYDLLPCVSIDVFFHELEQIIQSIDRIDSIRYISQNHQTNIASSILPNTLQNESNWSSSFSLDNWWLEAIGMSDVNYTGKGIKLAIMDTGISVHPDFFTDGNPLKSRIVASKNFTYENDISIEKYTYDAYGHGTHCAGIAGGNGELSWGNYRGVAPEVEIINAKVSNSSGSIEESDVIAAIEWCVERGAQIISMSFGGIEPTVWDIEALAIKKAVESGVVVVSSAGNSGPDFFTAGSPGTGLYSISVGATDINNHVASFSSLGPSYSSQIGPDVCAPGVNIISADSLNSIISLDFNYASELINKQDSFGYVPLSGTSMSCPMVAGAVAILLEAFPESTPETLRSALIIGSSKIERPSPEGYGVAQGAGLINVSKSLAYLDDLQSSEESINNQVIIFPREIPYAPFDLLRFPGNYQEMNLSLYFGEGRSIIIELPDLDGIELITPMLEHSLESHGIVSFPLGIRILHYADSGQKIGTLKILDKDTNRVLDSIVINITVAHSKQKILFESYHGLNDYYPSESPIYSQIQYYNMMYDLFQQNYSITYHMQNWTAGYSSDLDAELISLQSLADIDLLVLQTPVLAYSEFEVEVMVEFFNRGGSILFLGTKSNKMCVDSINSLFSNLASGISVSEDNIFNYVDYAIGASLSSHIVNNFDNQHPIFTDISNFKYAFGNSFTLSGDAENLASIYGKSVVSSFDASNIGKGKIIALGDYHTFGNAYYNDPEFYSNHSQLLLNIIDFLIPLDSIEIVHDLDHRAIDDESLNLSINIYDLEQEIYKTDLIPGVNLNTSIVYGNGTEKILSNQIEVIGNQYELDIILEREDISNETLRILTKVAHNSKIYQDYFEFYYYPQQIQGYFNITSNNFEINRSISSKPVVYIESSSDLQLLTHISIISKSWLSKNRLSELNYETKKSNISDFRYMILMNPSEFSTGGSAYAYSFTQDNSSHGYIDLTPARYEFGILNYVPEIDLEKSLIGSTKLSDTRSDGGIYPISAIIGSTYSLDVFVNEKVNFEDKTDDLVVVASIFPILVYNGYINFLYPIEIPTLKFDYNVDDSSYRSEFSFPPSLNYSRAGIVVSQSFKTDMVNYFTLLLITVRDSDGGSFSDFLLFYLYDEVPNISNYFPIIVTLAMLGAAILLVNYRKRIFNRNSTNEI